ncbi:MAG: hypothetical protein SFY32_14350 [Bacteroidota bacterium]|nr:hypothetical protein [Bacteroidota bacterium]
MEIKTTVEQISENKIEKKSNSPLASLLKKKPADMTEDLKDKYKSRLERSVLKSLGNLFG